MPEAYKFTSYLPGIVQFSVIDDSIFFSCPFKCHGLLSTLRVNDGKPRVEQRDIIFSVYPISVRSTAVHSFEHFMRCGFIQSQSKDSGDCTQVRSHPFHLCNLCRECMKLFRREILWTVMKMKSSKDMLSSILKTTQMGQIGIRTVLDRSMRPGLRKALESQLREYDAIESDAHAIACQRDWELPELDPAVRYMANMMTRAKLTHGNSDSKIAGMMIQGNTRGMIKGIKNQHQFNRQDEQVDTLCQKLLDCENANIRQMQAFL